MHVLVADDDRVTVQWLTSVLAGAGHRVTAAQDAQQAVMLAVRTLPDLAILDIGMPAGSGEFALQRLKASTKTNAIPVLVLTALKDPTLPKRVRDLGAAEVLFKPISPEVLCQAIERFARPPQGTAS
jgi:DNA-binding response OmpR family regulator